MRELERSRLALVCQRDGFFGMMHFAEQTYRQYRNALRDPKHYARQREYRRAFIESCLEFRRVLRTKESGNA